jgi:hypothetical protein
VKPDPEGGCGLALIAFALLAILAIVLWWTQR